MSAADVFESYSVGTELKGRINPDGIIVALSANGGFEAGGNQ